MSLLCSSDCTSISAITQYCDPCDGLITRQSGGDYVHFVDCTYQFNDVLDPAEWAQLKADGRLFSTPMGKWELPAPTVTNEKVTGCGLLVETSRTYAIPYETVCAAEDGSDFKYWCNLDKQYSNWRAIPQSCDGLFYLCDDYFDAADLGSPATVAGQSPGLEFSFSVSPYENREGDIDNLVKWQMTLDLKKRGVLKGIKLPGVGAVLNG